jgi:hypothetical protein
MFVARSPGFFCPLIFAIGRSDDLLTARRQGDAARGVACSQVTRGLAGVIRQADAETVRLRE